MKFNFKNAAEPLVDIAAVTAGAIASNQFLDFGKMFKTADPNGFVIKHQGGIKAVAAAGSIVMFGKKMPRWAKMLIIGVGVAGAIKEVRVMTTKIDMIGGADAGGSDTSDLDKLLKQAAMMGASDAGAGVGYANQGTGASDAGAGVGYSNPDIPQQDYGSTVGWI